MQRATDVLIVTATELETREFLKLVVEKTDSDFSEFHGETNTYFEFMIGETSCCLVWSDISAKSAGGSYLVVSDALKELSPGSVLMIGIAFGVDPEKQKIGDILISRQVADYSLRRVGTNEEDQSPQTIARGDRIPASPRLMQRLKAHSLRWVESSVQTGLILTGDDLIDNLGRRNELLGMFPEAIGGEMEGAGLYSSAYRRNTDWIIVKAICDWANNKGEDKIARQTAAIRNVSKFIIGAIEKSGFIFTHSDTEHQQQPEPKRFDLQLSLREGFYALQYAQGYDLENTVSLFQVDIMNVGTMPVYIGNITIETKVDGQTLYMHMFNFGDPYLSLINPSTDIPIQPGAKITYSMPFDALKQIHMQGNVVIPTHVVITDQIGNTYKILIDEKYRERMQLTR